MNIIVTHKTFSCLLIDGYEVLIDTEDIPRINALHWYMTYKKDGSPRYVKAIIGSSANNGGRWDIFLHRFLLSFPDGIGDHKKGNRLDNRKENLRVANPSQNASNSRRKIGRFGFIGVSRSNSSKYPYCSVISIKGKTVRSKSVKSVEEAAKLYDGMAKERYGEFAVLNF